MACRAVAADSVWVPQRSVVAVDRYICRCIFLYWNESNVAVRNDDSIFIDCIHIATIASLFCRRPAFQPAIFCRRMAYSSPDPSTCVLDTFRTSIAERVAAALPTLTVEQVYSGVDYGKKGADFTIALPRFKLGKVEDVAAKVVAQVIFFGG